MENRLGIFVMYDSDEIVDEYIIYLLNDIIKNVSHLVIVCNGKLQEESLEKLKRYSTDLFIRSNFGYDAGAIKDVFTTFIGWENIYEYSEVLIINNSCYGPLYPLENIFKQMEKKKLTFRA